jgi:hypothetical protein
MPLLRPAAVKPPERLGDPLRTAEADEEHVPRAIGAGVVRVGEPDHIRRFVVDPDRGPFDDGTKEKEFGCVGRERGDDGEFTARPLGEGSAAARRREEEGGREKRKSHDRRRLP